MQSPRAGKSRLFRLASIGENKFSPAFHGELWALKPECLCMCVCVYLAYLERNKRHLCYQ